MDETVWICERCSQTNFIIYDDILTSNCYNCGRTNMNILEILNAYKD